MAERGYMGIPREKIPWFPTIDEEKCINCGSCLDFCSNNVLEESEITMKVINPYNCVVGCSSCMKVCDYEAITFPSKDELIKWLYELRKSRDT